MLEKLQIRCLTGSGDVSANAYLVEGEGWSVLLDVGAVTGHARWLSHLKNSPDLVWVSHVHADHIGALPELYKRYPGVEVVMTPTSAALCACVGRGQDRAVADVFDVLGQVSKSLSFKKTMTRRFGETCVRMTPYACGHIPGAASLLLEVEHGEKFHRILYLPDFSAHAQPLTPRAEFPVFDEEAPLDCLIMEGMLGSDRVSDKLDYDKNLQSLVDGCAQHSTGGGQLVAVPSLGLSGEVVHALSEVLDEVYVHDYLEPIFKITASLLGEQSWADRGVRFVTQPQATRMLMAGQVVVASDEHLQSGSPSRALFMSIVEDSDSRIVLCNSTRKKSFAGKVSATPQGEVFQQGGLSFRRMLDVEHVLLPNHAPRWALMGTVKLLKPQQVVLVHGQRNALSGLQGALRKVVKKKKLTCEVLVPGALDVVVVT